MLILDYEHLRHNPGGPLSIGQSFAMILPTHWLTLILWLLFLALTILSIYRLIRQREQLITLQERLAVLQTQAFTDRLTGVWNRHGLDYLQHSCLNQARWEDQPLTLILADVNHFKSYNDTHGHVAGDKALQQIADLLKDHIRAQDEVVRYGGDEFIILCPELDGHGARRLIERLRAALPDAQVDLSFGAAVFPRDGRTIEALLQTADHRMYRAKNERKTPDGRGSSGA
jgi:diguanylate cyclase (GGDEF)-like protein